MTLLASYQGIVLSYWIIPGILAGFETQLSRSDINHHEFLGVIGGSLLKLGLGNALIGGRRSPYYCVASMLQTRLDRCAILQALVGSSFCVHSDFEGPGSCVVVSLRVDWRMPSTSGGGFGRPKYHAFITQCNTEGRNLHLHGYVVSLVG